MLAVVNYFCDSRQSQSRDSSKDGLYVYVTSVKGETRATGTIEHHGQPPTLPALDAGNTRMSGVVLEIAGQTLDNKLGGRPHINILLGFV